ncbi:hypothetical protein HY025_01780 [Candidatus Daviesbacteria bacterium]|nr:hypothetical protein [Candidatus Daviesbacteria bacterium]
MQTPEQQPLITEAQFIPPLIEILEEVTPKSINIQPQIQETSKSLKESLDNLFPEQKYEEKNLQRTKEILGELANDFSSEQLKDAITEVQYLAESWLDDFEREVFGGLTLKELLHEKGGL